MLAIRTSHYGPTNFTGDRIRAKCAAGALVMSYDYALDFEANHHACAMLLAERLGWTHLFATHTLVTGQMSDGSYAHVFAPKPETLA